MSLLYTTVQSIRMGQELLLLMKPNPVKHVKSRFLQIITKDNLRLKKKKKKLQKYRRLQAYLS